MGVYLFSLLSATKLHFFLGVFFHFIIGADTFDTAADFLKGLKESGEKITPKAWRAEAAKLTAQKDFDYQKMRDMRDEIKAVESLRKAAERLAREGQHQQKENER